MPDGVVKWDSHMTLQALLNALTTFILGSMLLFELMLLRSSHYRCSMKKRILKDFAKVKGKHVARNLFFKYLQFN